MEFVVGVVIGIIGAIFLVGAIVLLLILRILGSVSR